MLKLFFIATTFFIAVEGHSQVNQTERSWSKEIMPRLAPKTINYFSEFLGPTLKGEGFTVSSTGEADERDVTTWNQVSFQWELSEGFNFVFNPRFIINHSVSSDTSFDPESTVVGFVKRYKWDDLSLNLNFNTILPFMRDRDAHDDHITFNPGGFNSLSYNFNNGFNSGVWLWYRAYFYDGRKDPDSDPRLKSFVAPNITYNISDNIGSITAFYRWDEYLVRSGLKFEKDDNFNLMYTYTFNQYLTFQPFLTLFRADNYSLENAQVNLWLSGTFL